MKAFIAICGLAAIGSSLVVYGALNANIFIAGFGVIPVLLAGVVVGVDAERMSQRERTTRL